MDKVQNQRYDETDIQVLEGLEAVRKRPSMYIGATGSRGLHHLIWEIVDNAIDEALAGHCDDIEIILNKDGSITIKDDGRGIPVGIHKQTGISTVETVYTILHAGGKFGGGGYKVSGGLHGVGAAVVNALSEFVEVTVYQKGKISYVKFANGGHVVEPLKVIGECSDDRSGTTVTFKPDKEIFTDSIEFDYDVIRTRSRELAFLNNELRIILVDGRGLEEKKEIFHYEGGIKAYVELLNKNKTPIHDEIIYFSDEVDNELAGGVVSIEIAMQYNSTYTEGIYSFVNNIKTHEGGTHEDGVGRALTRVINAYARKSNLLKEADNNLLREDVREGLMMIISVKHPNPQFEGQTKTKLGNTEVRSISDEIFSTGLTRILMENPALGRVVFDKASSAARGRMAAKRARDLTRRKGDLELSNQWGKLVDCSSKDAIHSEIFIVEGDSAMGSAKQGRNPKYQAILPIRGKILNVEKARLDRILGNEEIRSIITAFGTGIGEDFTLNKLRYHKIIIMTDADVDGAHIRTLLLTFFFRFFKPLIENGNVYAAQPPLYKITHGKKSYYALNDAERDEIISTLPENSRYTIGRLKGLGEMNAIDLRKTTMDLEKRRLLKINIEDAILADETFQLLMGEEVPPRRKFIEENALNVRNLDV